MEVFAPEGEKKRKMEGAKCALQLRLAITTSLPFPMHERRATSRTTTSVVDSPVHLSLNALLLMLPYVSK